MASTLACGTAASEEDGDHKTKQCPFSTLLWSTTHTCSYDTMLQNIKNTILQSVLYSSNRRFSFLWLDGVRTSCRAVDGGMKSAKFMRRIIRICHAWKSGNNAEEVPRKIWKIGWCKAVKRQSLVKLPIWCTSSEVRKLKMHFWNLNESRWKPICYAITVSKKSQKSLIIELCERSELG